MDDCAITSFEIEKRGSGMDAMEDFFLRIGAEIKQREPNSLSAKVEHPDGLYVYIEAECKGFEKHPIKVTRRKGDTTLFHLLYQLIIAYDFGIGDDPNIYLGQLHPKIKMAPQEDPLMILPELCLDLNLKRKRE